MSRLRICAVLLCLVTAALGYFLREDPEVYIPYATVVPALFFLPMMLYRHSARVRQRVTDEWPASVERVGLIVLLLNVPGVLFFHELLPQLQFDRLLHFGAAAVGVEGVTLLLMPWMPHSTKRDLLWIVGCISFAFIFVWEGFQYAQDSVFGTRSFFDYAQPIVRDVWEDVVFGALGVAVGLMRISATYRRFERIRT